jgi:hypothetical protein
MALEVLCQRRGLKQVKGLNRRTALMETFRIHVADFLCGEFNTPSLSY